MPDVAAHYIFAKQVLASDDPPIKNLTAKQSKAYFWGACGPDFFYFDKVISGNSELPAYGTLFHHKDIGTIIRSAVNYLNDLPGGRDKEISTAYFYGLLCHYSLDHQVHPFVFYLQKQKSAAAEKQKPSAVHADIESDLDSALYRNLYNKNIRKFPVGRILTEDREVLENISELYTFLLKDIFDITVNKKKITSSLKQMRRLCILLYDTTGFAVGSITKAVDKMTGRTNFLYSHVKKKSFDQTVLNNEHSDWYNVNIEDCTRNESIDELFDAAQHDAHRLITQEAANLSLGNKSDCSESGIMAEGFL